MNFKRYSPADIEGKWQKIWDDKELFKAKDDTSLPKFYGLIEFPYPSGEGLHVGHPRSNTAIDIICRKRRMEGYNVLFPIGWDAFGLPTENFAMKKNIHPAIVTENNIIRFRTQLKSLGFSFDWSREVNTTDPNYYKWTQWIFLKMFEEGLAYKAEIPINWCNGCKVGLANEEVVNGVCERCGGEVVKKVKSQWMLKITDYAEKLIQGLDTVDFIEKVKIQQKNWIGKSEGAEVDFAVKGTNKKIRVYTTRPDTLFGATYMVVSPEHPLIEEEKSRLENYEEIQQYKLSATRKSDFERTEMAKDKTGVELKGFKAINPVNGYEIPIWISDYVLMTYGTGAIMSVPAHDYRDWEFAKKFDLPIVEVVEGGNVQEAAFTNIDKGTMVNSDFLNGLSVEEAKINIIDWLEKKELGTKKTNYKLRDWVFSRQRYWGEPIPLVNCSKCGWVPIPEDQLPVTLPEIAEYKPSGDGESPLSKIIEWVETTCPTCGGKASRETDTMPQWAGSSWYFLRYIDPNNSDKLADLGKMKYWLPVDWYNGGMEHTTLHLLYSRFWHKFLYDQGYVPTPEPYAKRTSHGMILGENNEKMSKSRGNVINPDDIVKEFGADTFRMYEMFIGAFDQPIPWSQQGLRGCRRFLDRSWRLCEMLQPGEVYSKELEASMHKTIKKVSEDYEKMKFNTAIATLMSLLNEFYEKNKINMAEFKTFITLLNPVAPHISEELWQLAGFTGMLHEVKWPVWDDTKIAEDTVEIAVQINGKVKSVIKIPTGTTQNDVKEIAMHDNEVKKHTEGKTIIKEIYVPNKIYNIVVK